MSFHPGLKYLDYGWPVIPTDGKRPLVKWKTFQTRSPTRADWVTWASRWPGCNASLLCGEVSGLVCLDVDGPGGLPWVARRGLPIGPLVVTPRGWRWICRSSDPAPKTWTNAGPGWSVTLLGSKALAVLPPGRHPSGARYTWAPGKSPAQLSPGPLPGRLWKSEDSTTGKISTNSASTNPTRKVFFSGTGLVRQGRRNATLFRQACKWVGLGMDPASVVDRLRSLNGSCAPPLPDGEVSALARSAERYRSPPPSA